MSGYAEFIEGIRPGAGEFSPLERARWLPDEPDREPADEDARVANLLSRGYQAGSTLERGVRWDDLPGRLKAAGEELARAEGLEAHAARLRERGQLDPFAWSDVSARADDAREEVSRLRQEIRDRDQSRMETAEAVSRAQQRVTDPVTAAAQRASRLLAEVAAAQSHEQLAARARTAAGERRPFASGGAAG
jgi:hypothetical protein